MTNTVKLTEFINDNSNLRVLQGQECVAGKEITVSDVYRPGLELSGYFDFYPADRVQLLGRTEISYAARLDHDLRRKVFEKKSARKKLPACWFPATCRCRLN